MNDGKVSSHNFYREYHGHLVSDLEVLLPELRQDAERLIWTAGDSSLDNKYWFRETAPAVGAYARVLEPPVMKQDVTYWLNQNNFSAINTAVEATTLNERTFRLWPQDEFLRDHIQSRDVLIVSIGGNDVALKPTPCTILSMCGALALPQVCIDKGCACGSVPVDDCCLGCGPSVASCACACPPCLGYFRHLFGTRVQKYVENLTAKTKPSKILVCMIYFLDETPEPGWAGAALGAMGYNRNPAKLQSLIRKAFYEATCQIQIPGTQVIPVPLFHVLDGKTSEDYVQRVEPSPRGGRKMAEFLHDTISRNATPNSYGSMSPPNSSYIRDRS